MKVEFDLLQILSQKQLASVDINESFSKEKTGVGMTLILEHKLAKCCLELSNSFHILTFVRAVN